jgi:hypothetical protein
MRGFGLRNTDLSSLVFQARRRKRIHAFDELVVCRYDEQQREGDNAGEEERGCEVKFERERTAVLCQPSKTDQQRAVD